MSLPTLRDTRVMGSPERMSASELAGVSNMYGRNQEPLFAEGLRKEPSALRPDNRSP